MNIAGLRRVKGKTARLEVRIKLARQVLRRWMAGYPQILAGQMLLVANDESPLGQAITQGLLQAGATVAVPCRNEAARYGALHGLVWIAEWQAGPKLVEMTLAQWEAAIAQHLTAAFLCAQAAARHFKAARISGKIIFVVPDALEFSALAAIGGGLEMLIKNMRQELAPLRIEVKAIAAEAGQPPAVVARAVVWALG